MTDSPPEYTLRLRRFDPESDAGAYWQQFTVALGGQSSVLDAILKQRNEVDRDRDPLLLPRGDLSRHGAAS